MDLLCTERVSPEGAPGAGAPLSAGRDPALLRRRVLANLLRTEERYAVTADYFGSVQRELTPHMRRLVADWMLEICDERKCQEEVFALAMSYLDRFLSVCAVGGTQLQLLGTACLLLASKLKEPDAHALPADLLVFYTANSITLTDLYNWELLVLSKLKWDVAGVTPHDFVPLLLEWLPLDELLDAAMITRHAHAFITMTARDYEFSLCPASTVAACSVAAALRGLGLPGQLARLQELTGVDLECLQTCLEQIEAMIEQLVMASFPNGKPRGEGACTPPPPPHPAPRDKVQTSAATPTDVRDVHF